MAKKLTNTRIIELLNELKKKNEDYYDPKNKNFDDERDSILCYVYFHSLT